MVNWCTLCGCCAQIDWIYTLTHSFARLLAWSLSVFSCLSIHGYRECFWATCFKIVKPFRCGKGKRQMFVCMSVWQTGRPDSGIHDKSIGKKTNPARNEWRLTASQSPSYLVWSEWRIKNINSSSSCGNCIVAILKQAMSLICTQPTRCICGFHTAEQIHILQKYIKNNFQLPKNFDGLIWFYALLKWMFCFYTDKKNIFECSFALFIHL